MEFQNKSISNIFFGKIKQKINNKKRSILEKNEDEDDDETLQNPFKLLKNTEEHIYIKENHIYYHTDVNEDSVDKVKKLMREYEQKFSNIKKSHTCVNITAKPLYIHIYSPGGDVYAGFSLYD